MNGIEIVCTPLQTAINTYLAAKSDLFKTLKEICKTEKDKLDAIYELCDNLGTTGYCYNDSPETLSEDIDWWAGIEYRCQQSNFDSYLENKLSTHDPNWFSEKDKALINEFFDYMCMTETIGTHNDW